MKPGTDPSEPAKGAILLEPGKKVSVHGVVTKPTRKERKDGPPLVEAELTRDEGSPVTVVWWEETGAPVEGSHVSVTGTVRLYGERPYVSVEDTRWLRPRTEDVAPGPHPYQRLLRYLYECVEAESGLDTILDPKDARILPLEQGRDPVVTRDANSDTPEYLTKERERRWFRIQRDAGRESILLGYPVIVGTREENGVPQTRLAPLFLVECLWEEDEHGVRLSRKDPRSEELAPGALELLGLGLEERERLAELLEGSSQVAEGTSPRDRLQLRMNILQDTGLFESLPAIDPDRLSPIGQAVAVFNSIVILPFDRSPYVRSLLMDLAKLGEMAPETLEAGPLGAILKGEKTTPAGSVVPEPTVLPSNYSQDVAIAGSLHSVLSVVTGPPGTGKSQMIVNAVAAAVCAGKTVLVASKNNQALDVVSQRVGALALELPAIRTGNRRYRQQAASKMVEVLGGKAAEDPALGSARVGWDKAVRPVREAHGKLAERKRRLTTLRAREAALDEGMNHLPQGVYTIATELDCDVLLDVLSRALEPAPWLLRCIPPLACRWRTRKINAALKACAALVPPEWRASLGLEELSPLPSSASTAEIGALLERLGASRALLERVRECSRVKTSIDAERAELERLPSLDELERQIARGDEARRVAGRALVNAAWNDRFTRATLLFKQAAWMLVQQLAAFVAPIQAPFSLQALATQLLAFLPAWLVSSLSVRGTFPLLPGLIDLVIVDEASQGDVASLVPLLFRAKRAMIVGDPQQLTHVTRLSAQREKRIADEVGVGDALRERWNYVSANAFSLSAGSISGAPTILEQHFRSHPAIIEFCNTSLYDSALVVCTDPSRWADRVGLEWLEVSGEVKGTAAGSRYNDEEARRVAEVVTRLQGTASDSLRSFGVVSPYRAQADLIKKYIGDHGPNAGPVTVGTAHAFQGDERDVMVYSPVISGTAAQMKGLLAARPQLINVAISRAAKRLVVVGDRRACLGTSPSLLESLARYSLALEQSQAHSPFEISLAEKLREAGADVTIGKTIHGVRTGLLVKKGASSILVDCNGHAFEDSSPLLDEKDARLKAQGARVVRFSPRHLRRDLDACAQKAMDALANSL